VDARWSVWIGAADYLLMGCTFSTGILHGMRGDRPEFLRIAQSEPVPGGL